MRYPPYFISLVFISGFIGIIISFLNNDIILESSNNNIIQNNNEYSRNNEILKKIKEKEDLKKEIEKRKNSIEQQIKQIETEINNYDNIKTEDKKNIISCAYALDNKYVYPTLVSMTSLTENAGKNTFYNIYTMINPEFTEENKNILKSVENKHPNNCKVIFIDMGNKYKNVDSNLRITTPAYYKLELHNLLPDVNRIIWMDGDTAVFEDLTELINLNMKGNYIMGFLDSLPKAMTKFGIKDATVLCTGVLLMDLDALRKNKISEKFNKFIDENIGNITQHDQTVINAVCQGKIAPLPPKYGIWSFEDENEALKHNNRQKPWLKYNKEEFLEAYYHPVILHYSWPKPFWHRQKPIFDKEWWNYAKISGYYDDIYNKSPKYIHESLINEKNEDN
jgi:lipopolysaccharide biosynthesis glycosyltransferase